MENIITRQKNKYIRFALISIIHLMHPYKACCIILLKIAGNRLSDETFKRIHYKLATGHKLNFKNPRRFNEKIAILSLRYKNRPDITELVDKYAVRRIVAEKLLQYKNKSAFPEFVHTTKNGYLTYNECEYLIPLIEVYDSFDEIDFGALPDKFVLKCTHDSGSVVICNDKAKFDKETAGNKLTKALKNEFWKTTREYQYQNVIPKIICEEYIGDNIYDYKLFTFGGKTEVIQVDYDRFTSHKRNMYDPSWNFLPLSIGYPNDPARKIEKPEKLDSMLRLSNLLMINVNAPHCRVDLYCSENKILFGEMTFTHGAGTEKFTPDEWDRKFGDMIAL